MYVPTYTLHTVKSFLKEFWYEVAFLVITKSQRGEDEKEKNETEQVSE